MRSRIFIYAGSNITDEILECTQTWAWRVWYLHCWDVLLTDALHAVNRLIIEQLEKLAPPPGERFGQPATPIVRVGITHQTDSPYYRNIAPQLKAHRIRPTYSLRDRLLAQWADNVVVLIGKNDPGTLSFYEYARSLGKTVYAPRFF